MLFRKRRRPLAAIHKSGGAGGASPSLTELVPIDFDMMVKGAKVLRNGKTVRQYVVMVGATPRLVTSGDQVERAVYEALLEVGAVVPFGKNTSPSKEGTASGDR